MKRQSDRTSRTAVPGTAAPVSLGERIKERRKPLLITALLIAGLGFAAGWNPPTTTVHTFTEASEYNARRESGCTNSGEGCHGDDASLKDFNAYHPETPCKTCHEYTGVGCIPCHGPAQHECTGCHDGSMEGVSDCVRLSDSFPKGHYRESLHTAMGTDMSQVMLAAVGGEAKATCANCHSRDLRDAHTGVPEVEGVDYGTDIGCAECHNDKKSGSLDAVLNDWKRHRCEDCHDEKAPAPMHAIDVAALVEGTGDLACGSTGAGCHTGNDLHALHPDKPATCAGAATESEPGCHDLEIQSHKPTATACGQGEGTCHTGYRNVTYTHDQDDTVHISAVQRSAAYRDAASGLTVTCGACHSADLAAEHRRPNSPLAGNECAGCHNKSDATVKVVKESWTARDSSRACAACHERGVHGDVDTVHNAVQLDDAGTPSGTSCVKAGCHATADVRVLHAAKGCAFAGCHSNAGSIFGSDIMTCGGPDSGAGTSCHTTSSRHVDVDSAHVATQIDHRGAASATGCARPGCHPTGDVRVLHANAGGCATPGCHVAGGPTYMTCGGAAGTPACHTASDTNKHADIVPKHLAITYSTRYGTLDPLACTDAGCHPTNNVRTLHRSCSIAGCHVAGGPAKMSCGGLAGSPTTACHNTSATQHLHTDASHLGVEVLPNGTPTPGACVRAGCHAKVTTSTKTGTDVRYMAAYSTEPTTTRAHTCHDTPGCHVVGGPKGVTCGGSATSGATNCHTYGSMHASSEAKHLATTYSIRYGTLDALACTDAGCHPTNNVRDLHGSCFIAECHVTGGLTKMSCGGLAGLPGTACHNVAATQHLHTNAVHLGVETLPDGTSVQGACVRAGCHAKKIGSTKPDGDVRDIAVYSAEPTTTAAHSCHNTPGCHVVGGPYSSTCGGTNPAVGCHSGGTIGPLPRPVCTGAGPPGG